MLDPWAHRYFSELIKISAQSTPPQQNVTLAHVCFFILYLFYDPLRITKKRKREAFQSAGAPYAPGRPTTESFAAEKF